MTDFSPETIKQLLDVNADDETTQKARIAACKDKNICLVTCPYTSARLHYTIPRDMGFNVYVLGNPSSAFCEALEKDGLATFLKADMSNDRTALANALAAILGSGVTFDSIFTVHEIAIPLVCQLTETLGLPGNSSLAASQARNKNQAREVCKKAGLRTPRFCKVSSVEELKAASEYVQFPAVAKPSNGAGSVGVIRVNSYQELLNAFDKIYQDMTGHDILNWNPGCDDISITLEQYLLGDEFDVDILMWNGDAKYVAVSDNWATFEPYFQETGSNCPSVYPQDKIQEINEYAVEVTKALGFSQGAFHVELKYTSDGPVLIENNPRMGGGVVREFNMEVYGVDLLENFILTSAGIPINPPQSKTPRKYIAHYYVNAFHSGTVENSDFLKSLENEDDVAWTKCYVKPGQIIKGLDQGFPQHVGEICVKRSDNVEKSIERVHQLVKTVTCPVSEPLDVCQSVINTVG